MNYGFGGGNGDDQPPFAVPCHVFRGQPHWHANHGGQLQRLAAAAASQAGQTASINPTRPEDEPSVRPRHTDGKFKTRPNPLQDRPRVHGRFATTSQVTYHDLTEAQIRPLMKYCRVTAAEMLRCSMYQLKMACKMLNLKWPHTPEVQTPEHHKAVNRKKKKERIPKNSVAFLYCEKDEEGSTRFHELRISSSGRDVFARFGRVDPKHRDYRANRKSHFESREEAMRYCEAQRAELGNNGWMEKSVPTSPSGKPTPRQKVQLSMTSKRKQVKAQLALLESMRDANIAKPGTHSPEEVGEVLKKFDSLRASMHREARRSKGLIEATREQREKVKDMKKANSERPGTYSADEVGAASDKLRELMCKYSARSLIPTSELKAKAESEVRRKIREMKDANRRRAGTYPPEKIENEVQRLREITSTSSKAWGMGLRGKRTSPLAAERCASAPAIPLAEDADALLPETSGVLASIDTLCASAIRQQPHLDAPALSDQTPRKRARGACDDMLGHKKSKIARVEAEARVLDVRQQSKVQPRQVETLHRTSGRPGVDSEGEDWREFATPEGYRYYMKVATRAVQWAAPGGWRPRPLDVAPSLKCPLHRQLQTELGDVMPDVGA